MLTRRHRWDVHLIPLISFENVLSLINFNRKNIKQNVSSIERRAKWKNVVQPLACTETL
jgi:hypothetical protein